MKKIKAKTVELIVLISIMVLPLTVMAQGPVDPEDTPIDGGLTLLIAAGAAYGVKKYREGNKKNEEQID